MYYELDGRLFGVLNDFDLATIMNVGERSLRKKGPEHTGTLPYMANDLLDPERGNLTHWFRHDLESCMWCIIFHSLQRADEDWYSEDPSYMQAKQICLMSRFSMSFLKTEWRPWLMFLFRWIRTYDKRLMDVMDSIRMLDTVEEQQKVRENLDEQSKDEDYMKSDAQLARDLCEDKEAEALQDLGWIDVKVDTRIIAMEEDT